MPWHLSLPLDPAVGDPLYQQLARALRARIRSGGLKPGERLPGSRSLAAQLALHRNTVIAAYRELEAEGWIESVRRSGTRVSTALPAELLHGPRARRPAPGLGFTLRALDPQLAPPPAEARAPYAFFGGLPDLRQLPLDELARAYRRALKSRGRDLLGYDEPHGHHRLRAALAVMLRDLRGLDVGVERLIVTRGSQQALALIARALLVEGDLVAVENPGYARAWQALRHAGARLTPLPVDEAGLDVDALERLTEREPVRALYLTPHHQFPTTVTLAAARRLRLLDLARRQRFAIIEDDFDFEFHYDGQPVLPLASGDGAGVVVYVGTLSKILAPGLRLGFVAAPEALTARLGALRLIHDVQGDRVLEAAVAELLEDDLLQRHARKMRRLYHARRDRLASELEACFGSRLAFRVPSGGMSLWVEARNVDVPRWVDRCRARGVTFPAGARFDFHGRALPFLRLGFASLDETELREAVRRMRIVLP